VTRTCAYKHCEIEFEPRRPHQRFHSDRCRYADWLERQENSGEDGAQRVGDGSGSRGGNVRDLDTARDLQAQVKAKRDWSGAIDEQIRLTLLATGYFHADDLDELCVPPEHAQLKGTRSAWFRNQGFMEKTGAERKVSHKAANGRKAAIHRITPKGRRELTVGVGAGGEKPRQGESLSRVRENPLASADPGEPQRRPTGNTSDRSGSSSPNPPAGGASEKDGGSGVPSQAPEPAARPYEALSLLADVDPEAWAA